MSASHQESWVDWFLAGPLGRWFVRVDDSFLTTEHNYYGIQQKVPNFHMAYELIIGPKLSVEAQHKNWPKDIDVYGTCLYGFLHARYLLTSAGLEKMYAKYTENAFPSCPRTLCCGFQMLPMGRSDVIGHDDIKFFCPNCQKIYNAPIDTSLLVDGAFFGPSWIHLFIAKFNEFRPKEPLKVYIPRIYGFRTAERKNEGIV